MRLFRHITIVCLTVSFLADAGEQLRAKAKGAADQPAAVELQPLQGTWEAGEGDGKITIPITGDSLHFHRDTNFWFETTITLPAGKDPKQFHATIKDCPTASSIGQVVRAFFKIEDGTLTVATMGAEETPEAFEAAVENRFELRKVQPQKKMSGNGLGSLVFEGHELHASLRTRQPDEPHRPLPPGLPRGNPHLSTDAEFVEMIARGASQGSLGREGIRSVLSASYVAERELGFYGLEAESVAEANRREDVLRETWAHMGRINRARVHRAGLVLLVVWHRGVSPECWEAVNARVVERLNAFGSRSEDSAIGPPPRLRFQTVRSILHDSKGNYWFGSWNEGVCRFDGKSLTYFTVNDGLSDNQIRSIQEDRNGVVWFECGVGISGFDGEKIITPTNRNYTSKNDWQLGTGDLWFKEDGAAGATELEARPGVYRYDGKTFTYLTYPVPDERASVSAYATGRVAKGKNGRLWFATYNAVFGYDGKCFTIIDDKSLGLNEHTGRLHVRCVLEDSRGKLWIGNNGIGVILHDGDTATHFTQEKGLGKMGPHGGRATPLPGDVTDGSPTLHRVFSIGEDRAGNIWFGTIDHGAWRYDGKLLRNYTPEDGLTSKQIMGIYTDRHGDLWLAGDGVFKFNGASFDRIH